MFDQRFDPGATTGVTAGDAGDRLVGRGGGTVERDFGATGRDLRQARGYPVGDERAVSEQVDDEAHARERGVQVKEVGAQENLSASEKQKDHAVVNRIARQFEPGRHREFFSAPRRIAGCLIAVAHTAGQVAPLGQFKRAVDGLAAGGGAARSRLPVVGLSGSCFLAAGESPAARGTVLRNLLRAPPTGSNAHPGNQRLGLGDDFAAPASVHRAHRRLKPSKMGHQELQLQ